MILAAKEKEPPCVVLQWGWGTWRYRLVCTGRGRPSSEPPAIALERLDHDAMRGEKWERVEDPGQGASYHALACLAHWIKELGGEWNDWGPTMLRKAYGSPTDEDLDRR